MHVGKEAHHLTTCMIYGLNRNAIINLGLDNYDTPIVRGHNSRANETFLTKHIVDENQLATSETL